MNEKNYELEVYKLQRQLVRMAVYLWVVFVLLVAVGVACFLSINELDDKLGRYWDVMQDVRIKLNI